MCIRDSPSPARGLPVPGRVSVSVTARSVLFALSWALFSIWYDFLGHEPVQAVPLGEMPRSANVG
eukprot:12157628-Alexandrium_andersonii.AAC.1